MNRIFSISIVFSILFISACRKDIAPVSQGEIVPTTIIAHDFSFSGIVDSIAISFSQHDPNFIYGWDISKQVNIYPVYSFCTYQSYLGRSLSLNPAITINRGTIYFYGSTASDTAFRNFFSLGLHPYTVGAIDGMEVNWHNNGALYSTSEGTAIQGSNTFTITNVSFFRDENNILCAYVTANFSCNLYNDLNPTITLTNGIYIGVFKNL